MAQVKPPFETFARIKVIGVGGGGNKAIQRMMLSKIHGVDFVAVNLDAQDLNIANTPTKILIGKNLTRGLGAGMNPEVGRQAAMESSDEIADVIRGSDMVFITAGMGGGTGTGAAPVVAEIAREIGALTVGVVTKPFSFEGAARTRIAEEGLNLLKDKVDALITIPNDRLMALIDRKTPILEAFAKVDDVLRHAVQGISDLITNAGIINVDFNDVKTIMSNSGSALMGIGYGSGDDRAIEAAKMAINSPLLEIAIDGAHGVLLNVSGGADLSMLEVSDAARIITEKVDPDAKVIFGATQDDTLKKGEIKITVIATGFINGAPRQTQQPQSIHHSLFDDIPTIGGNGSFSQSHPSVSTGYQSSQQQHPSTNQSGFSSSTFSSSSSYNGKPASPTPSITSFSSSTIERVERITQAPLQPRPQVQQSTQPVVRELVDSSVADQEDEFDIPAFIRRKMSK